MPGARLLGEPVHQVVIQPVIERSGKKGNVDSFQQVQEVVILEVLHRERGRSSHKRRKNGLPILLLLQGGEHLLGAVTDREQRGGDRPGRGAEQSRMRVPAGFKLLQRSHKDHALGAAAFKNQIVFHGFPPLGCRKYTTILTKYTIFITGDHTEEPQVKSPGAGSSHHVKKPSDIITLWYPWRTFDPWEGPCTSPSKASSVSGRPPWRGCSSRSSTRICCLKSSRKILSSPISTPTASATPSKPRSSSCSAATTSNDWPYRTFCRGAR